MSQTKAVVETIDVSIGQIKPSPYQPRLAFDLEDLRESIQRDGMLVPLTVREKDGYYELIDGERRVRLAKELKYKTVPCTVINVDDETARRMVYKVNKERKDYTPYEEAVFFRKLVEEGGMKPYQIEAQLRVDHNWVMACLNVWKLPKDLQDNVFGLLDQAIPYRIYLSDVYRLETEIMRNVDEAVQILRQIIQERMTADEKRAFIGKYKKKINDATVEKALEKVSPEAKLPETSEEFEKAAKTLIAEAKKHKTPKQFFEEKKEKARKSLLTGRGNVQSKIEKVMKLGIDTAEFEERIEKIKVKIVDDPDEALKEIKKVKKDIDKAVKDFKEKQREAEIREKVEKEVEERRKEEVKEELMKDEKFLEDATKKLVSKRKIESAEGAKKLFADLGLPPIDKQIEDIYAKRKPLVDVSPVWSPEEEIKFVKGFLKRKGLKCSICGESEIMWRCRHEFK